jgi:predicted DCC family thiol-disulfide oxidoreductase YuxK
VPAPPTILFDGVCNFCNGWVLYVIDHDPDARFRFASFQSAEGRALLEAYGVAPPPPRDAAANGAEPGALPETIVLIQDDCVYERSTAVLRVLGQLASPVRFARGLLAVPRPVRDAAYRFFAKNRYAWFGRQAQCRLPTPELAARFAVAPAIPTAPRDG